VVRRGLDDVRGEGRLDVPREIALLEFFSQLITHPRDLLLRESAPSVLSDQQTW
jgi:hypothetical protein